jgi:hypothetical protein
MREVSEGLVFDPLAIAVGAAQEVGLINAPLVGAFRGGYMNGTGSTWHVGRIENLPDRVKTSPKI